MINELKVWRFIFDRLNHSQPVMLLCVLESIGSSPGRRGFKMAVTSDDMCGSIGGGIMEHKFVEMAKEKLSSLTFDSLVRKQIHDKSAAKNQSGMICSGEQTILLYHLTKSHLGIIEKIISCLVKNQNGHLNISSDEFIFIEGNNKGEHFIMNWENDWKYQEILGYKNHLYIIGGGHCALALSEFMSHLDFYIHLYEERNNLNTYNQNEFTNEKQLVNDYSILKDLIPSGNNNYVVIMTFGYRTDDTALRSLIEKDFKYLGVLGSATKMEKMFEEWRRDLLPEEKLKKIYAPSGLNISSQSPEEIAISIAAEIISVKNQI